MGSRMDWVDVLRFLGIWAIYIGHFGQLAGHSYLFVFSYHVPLFFFVAGFFSPRSLNKNPRDFIMHKARQLMVPYATFSVILLCFYAISQNWGIPQTAKAFLEFVGGVRNDAYVGSLWFIPCLFVMMVMDYMAIKLLKYSNAVLMLSVVAFIASQTLLKNNPAANPSWFWNFDSALLYWVFFTIGRAIFPYLNASVTSLFGKVVNLTLIIFSLVVACMSFFSGSGWLSGLISHAIPLLGEMRAYHFIMAIIIPLILIYSNIIFAKFLSDVFIFRDIGRETLALCGFENLIKNFLPQLMSMVGLTISLQNPFLVIVFAFICLLVARRILVNFCNINFPFLVGKNTTIV